MISYRQKKAVLYCFRALLLSAVLTSCEQKAAQTDFQVIDVQGGSETTFALSDLTAHLDSLHPELSDSSLLYRVSGVIDADDCYVFYSNEYILAFDKKSGKFLRRIASKGQGQQEYTRISDIVYKDKVLYISTKAGRILRYGIDGVFLDAIENDFLLTAFNHSMFF